MDAVFNSVYARVCMGAGLSVLTGLRAFLPLAFLALYSRLEFASAPVFKGTWFEFLDHTWIIVLLFVLAVIEIAVDKMPAIMAIRDQIMQPVKIVLGGLVFAAAMAEKNWIIIVVCAILGLVIAGLADHTLRSVRPGATADSGPIILLGVYTDLTVLVGTLVFVLVPLLGALLVLLLFLFAYRLQQRQKRKHKGLRILQG
ncbi:MAG: DUF4126 domain-containing protein [Thermoleophilia bacterium]|jgi:uncharacterized membrane protein